MSYVGSVSSPERAREAALGAANATQSRGSNARPADRPARLSSSDHRQTAIFAAGVVLGLAVGAGVALLFAPESGVEVRRSLARRGRRVRIRSRDAWDDLRDELRTAVRNRKRAWRRSRIAEPASVD